MSPPLLYDGPMRENAPALAGPFGFPPGQEVEATIAMEGGRRGACVLACASGWLPLAGGGGAEPCRPCSPSSRSSWRRPGQSTSPGTTPLTRLAGSTKFQQALAHLPAHGAVLILLGSDHLKEANDRCGHAAGEALLCEAASSLQAALQPGDLACRLGGGEFALLVRGTDAAACADTLAHRLARALFQPHWVCDVGLAMSAMGVRIALDDFGSGVSSASRLGRLPINLVKPDHPIVAGPGGKGRDRGSELRLAP